MKLENPIGWTDCTTNAVTGCDKVSPGCKNCYAAVGTRARVLRAQGIETWGPAGVRYPVNFEPTFRRLNKLCVCDKCHTSAGIEFLGGSCIYQPNHVHGDSSNCQGTFRRIRLFADSNSDWLDPKWPLETMARFLDAIRLAPNINVLLLTKRIENFNGRLGLIENSSYLYNAELKQFIRQWRLGYAPSNVWIGVSVEDQKRADERIPQLLKTPAAVRFLSVEPLLEDVQFEALRLPRNHRMIDRPALPGYVGIDWVIVGGESGLNRRPVEVGAIENIVDQCVAAGVPVYCKQDVHFKSGQQGRISDHHWSFKQFPK